MLNIYLVRHGETEWNIQRRMQGWQDSNLTEKGIEEAEALHDHLSDMEFHEIYSSPSIRAYKTAEILKGDRNLQIIKEEDLREINLGDWEGKTSEEIEAQDPTGYHHFWKAPHLYSRKQGEDFEDVKKRGLKVINRLMKEKKEGNILVVTHGVTLKVIMSYFEGRSLEKLWEPPYIKNTSLSLISMEDGNPTIKLYADTSHIVEAYEEY